MNAVFCEFETCSCTEGPLLNEQTPTGNMESELQAPPDVVQKPDKGMQDAKK